MCVICMKYTDNNFNFIISLALGQIFLSYINIANTSRTHARVRTHSRTHMHAQYGLVPFRVLQLKIEAHRRCHRLRTGYRYSVAPNRDGPLPWRQCRLLAIHINTRAGDPISPRFWMFFAYKKIARPNWDANS